MIRNWIGVHCLFLGMALSAGAHVGDRLYPIVEITEEMLSAVQLDGSVEEWYELASEPTMTLLDFAELEGAEPDPSDLDFWIWLAWHDDPDRLYAAFVSSDDAYYNTHDYDAGWDWHDGNLQDLMFFSSDSISLTIDGDHSGGVNEGPTLESRGQTQVYDAVARTVGGPTLDDAATRYGSGEFPWTALPPHGDGSGSVVGEGPVICVIELYVTPFDRFGGAWDSPEGSLVSNFSAGKVIGFGVYVRDYDSSWGKTWAPSGISIVDPERLLDGVLLSADREGTAVEESTWGRIKASLWSE